MAYLNEKQYRCIEMLVEKNMNVSETARELGVARNTIYNWMQSDEFKAELGRTEQEIKDRTHQIFIRRLPEVIEKLYKLTDCSDNRTKIQAINQWVDRALGKVSTSVTVEDKRENQDDYDIREALTRIEDNTTPITQKFGISG